MEHKKKKHKLKKEFPEPDDLKKQLYETEKTAERYLIQLQYLQADFENYKKSATREKENFVRFANEKLILKLLNILDEFESAFSALEKAGESEDSAGFKIIYKNLLKILEGEGLKPLNSYGKKFDHNYHEALMREDSGEEEGTILEEFQRGYMLGDKVIRHARVKVARNIDL